jgi:hypothetical protein
LAHVCCGGRTEIVRAGFKLDTLEAGREEFAASSDNLCGSRSIIAALMDVQA